MVGHTFLVLLIPLLAALFYFSTPFSRRQPIFILNVIAVILALTAGVAADVMNVSVTSYVDNNVGTDQDHRFI